MLYLLTWFCGFLASLQIAPERYYGHDRREKIDGQNESKKQLSSLKQKLGGAFVKEFNDPANN